MDTWLLHVTPMAMTRVTTVIRVCPDCDSYFKIGPNHKKRGSNCWVHQALFTLKMTTIFETLVFKIAPYYKRANSDHYDIASKRNSKHTHKPQKTQWWTPSHVHVVETALFAKCKPNVGPILGTLHEIYYYYFQSIRTLFKFGNSNSRKLIDWLRLTCTS